MLADAFAALGSIDVIVSNAGYGVLGPVEEVAPAMAEYDATPAGEVRQALAGGTFTFPNEPGKITAAIIGLVDSGAAPLRLTLGSDAYQDVHAALTARLAELEAQRDVALPVARG